MTAEAIRAEMRTTCETTVEGILRDAAQYGWEMAQAGASCQEARVGAVVEAQEAIVGIVGEILKAGAVVSA